MLNLPNNACEHVTPDDWKKVNNKMRKIITEYWERDVRFDSICDKELTINLQDSSSDSYSDDDDDTDFGCTPLSQ